MNNNLQRLHICYSDPEWEKSLKKLQKDAGFGSRSSLVKTAVNEFGKRFYGGSSAEIKQLENKIEECNNLLYKKMELMNERLELVSMRISKEGITSKTGQAMKDLLNLLLNKDSDHSMLLAKCRKYDSKTLDKALSLLIDAEIVDYHSKKISIITKKEKSMAVKTNDKK